MSPCRQDPTTLRAIFESSCGAVVVSPRAGETIAEATVAVQQGLSVADLTAATHPYPGWSDGWWNAAVGAYQASLARPPATFALRTLRALRSRRVRSLAPSADHRPPNAP